MDKLIVLIILLSSLGCKSQSFDDGLFIDKITLSDHYAIIEIKNNSESLLTSELDILYIYDNELKVHTLINSSIEKRNVDTTYILPVDKLKIIEKFFYQVSNKSNMNNDEIIAGTRTQISIKMGKDSYYNESKSFISLYQRLINAN